VIDDALKQAGVSLAQVATLFNEAKTDIISVPGLTSILATQEGTDRLTSRFANAALLKSAHNVLLLQGGDEASAEKWETRQIDFAGFPPILQLYLKVAAAERLALRHAVYRRQRHNQLLRPPRRRAAYGPVA
jgi:hypothetical protein